MVELTFFGANEPSSLLATPLHWSQNPPLPCTYRNLSWVTWLLVPVQHGASNSMALRTHHQPLQLPQYEEITKWCTWKMFSLWPWALEGGTQLHPSHARVSKGLMEAQVCMEVKHSLQIRHDTLSEEKRNRRSRLLKSCIQGFETRQDDLKSSWWRPEIENLHVEFCTCNDDILTGQGSSWSLFLWASLAWPNWLKIGRIGQDSATCHCSSVTESRNRSEKYEFNGTCRHVHLYRRQIPAKRTSKTAPSAS